METDFHSIVLSVASGLIVILLAVVGYWLSRYVSSTDRLTMTVTKLNLTVAGLLSDQKSFKEACSERHSVTVKRLDSHAEKLDKHDRRITKLEAVK